MIPESESKPVACVDDITGLLAKDSGSDNKSSTALSDSESSTECESRLTRRCVGCGRLFVPAGAQRYCDHDCYSDTLRIPIEHRFWERINKNGPIPAHMPHLGPCWLWTGSTARGYGQVNLGRLNGKQRIVKAHRFAYELANGPLPSPDIKACHHCDEPLCCRASHMFAGTQQDNLKDGRAKGRIDSTRPRVQVFTPEERLHIFLMPNHRGICVELARQHGVSKACISKIRRGRFARLSTDPQRRRSA